MSKGSCFGVERLAFVTVSRRNISIFTRVLVTVDEYVYSFMVESDLMIRGLDCPWVKDQKQP